MNSLILVIISSILYIIAYKTYGRFLSKRIFKINKLNKCPSYSQKDGCDFIPTSKTVLFGHHFTSIAGTGPIIGPAIALIWGWLPALIWIILGSIFMGAVHDFGSMMISIRHQGRSIGDITESLISKRVSILFMLIIFFALLIVIAIFGSVIADVFSLFPESVISVWLQIPIAIWLGYSIYVKKKSYISSAIVAVMLMYLSIFLGLYFPINIPNIGILTSKTIWTIILLIYAYIASVLPVNILLQPRDYINAFQLVIAMFLLVSGIIIDRPQMNAPLYQSVLPEGTPPILPYLFIILACGAISGFHCLVASGTSSKQCDNEKDAQAISYGSMILEGFLAILVIIACGAGLSLETYHESYSIWDKTLEPNIESFVNGSSNIITSLGIHKNYALALMGLFIAAFAATTLDTSTRIQRYIITDLSKKCHITILTKKHPATALAIISALALSFSEGGKDLWPLFGAINQLLAALALLVITVWLSKKEITIIYTLIPMIFMLIITAWAMYYNISNFCNMDKKMLILISIIIIIFEFWILYEGIIILFRKLKSNK